MCSVHFGMQVLSKPKVVSLLVRFVCVEVTRLLIITLLCSREAHIYVSSTEFPLFRYFFATYVFVRNSGRINERLKTSVQ